LRIFSGEMPQPVSLTSILRFLYLNLTISACLVTSM
jgi:hypothetical protein